MRGWSEIKTKPLIQREGLTIKEIFTKGWRIIKGGEIKQ